MLPLLAPVFVPPIPQKPKPDKMNGFTQSSYPVSYRYDPPMRITKLRYEFYGRKDTKKSQRYNFVLLLRKERKRRSVKIESSHARIFLFSCLAVLSPLIELLATKKIESAAASQQSPIPAKR